MARLAEENAEAKGLIATGVFPQQFYGIVANGAPPTTRREIRRTAALVLKSGLGVQPCLATALAMRGPAIDPEINLPLVQISTWMDFFAKWDGSSLEIPNKVWALKYAEFARNKPGMWTKVAGPISATIATLE